jgi:hypothetical protein
MDVETTPAQPEPVLEALAAVLAEAPQGPDPWWEAGIRENLAT